jgi:threonine-phosphate decarboxylase
MLGLSPVSSAAPFLLVPVCDARELGRDLLQHHCLVRDCSSFGLATYVRISARNETDNEVLLAAMREIRSGR